MKEFSINQVRDLYLKFHESKGHSIRPSAPLVPKEDPTVLFNTAGMQPMIPYLTGESIYPDGKTRVANSQICIRTDDIEEVGDNRHCTFFEMLGNWSINDYFKSDIIPWSVEFLTSNKWLSLDPNRLYATVYKGNKNETIDQDQESIDLWKSEFKKLNIESDVQTEFDFKKFKNENPQSNIVLESEKYIILDFDGVVADTLHSAVDYFFQNRDAFDMENITKSELIVFLSKRFSTPKSGDHVASKHKNSYISWVNERYTKIKLFREFLKTLGNIDNAKFAIVTDNSAENVQKILDNNKFESLGLNIDMIVGDDDGYCKKDKIDIVCKRWNIKSDNAVYITDTVRDKLELEDHVGRIIAKFGGFCLEKDILNNFEYQNIIFRNEDIFEAFKPTISKLAGENIPKFISRIRKMSGKDNWWGLPYRGPCGPCSEMYYLLNHNPLDFESSILPYCTINQVENFIEDQIVEIGNNVFMMYKGEKDENKEPMDTEDLGMKNVDTGLGLERFLMAINGYTSVYEIDTYKDVLSVVDKWSK